MRWRIAVLAVLATGCGIASAVCLTVSSRLIFQINAIYTSSSGTDPSARDMRLANALSVQASILQTLISPLAFGCVLALVAILVVLVWNRELRDRELQV